MTHQGGGAAESPAPSSSPSAPPSPSADAGGGGDSSGDAFDESWPASGILDPAAAAAAAGTPLVVLVAPPPPPRAAWWRVGGAVAPAPVLFAPALLVRGGGAGSTSIPGAPECLGAPCIPFSEIFLLDLARRVQTFSLSPGASSACAHAKMGAQTLMQKKGVCL